MRRTVKVYIAAPYACREDAAQLANQLAIAGFAITSYWVWVDEDKSDAASQRSYAERDLADIDDCDALVLMTGYTGPRSHTGGCHTEFGYALARGKKLYVTGCQNVFHHLAEVTSVAREDVVRVLKLWSEARG